MGNAVHKTLTAPRHASRRVMETFAPARRENPGAPVSFDLRFFPPYGRDGQISVVTTLAQPLDRQGFENTRSQTRRGLHRPSRAAQRPLLTESLQR